MFRRLSLVLGLALVAALVPAAAAQADPPRDSVKIVAILYNPPGADSGQKLRLELVILKNTGKHAVQLKDWTVSDKDDHEYTFKRVSLKKGDSITLHTGKGKDNNKHVYWDRKNQVWDNDRDTAFLHNDKYKLVDKCAYHGTLFGITFCR